MATITVAIGDSSDSGDFGDKLPESENDDTGSADRQQEQEVTSRTIATQTNRPDSGNSDRPMT